MIKSERSLLTTLLMTTLPITVLVAAAFAGGKSQAEPPVVAKTTVAPPSTSTISVTQEPRVLPPAENGIGRLIANVGFTDLLGKKGSLSGTKRPRATVVAFTSSSCPVSKQFAPTLSRLEAEYKAKGVDFVFVDPITSDTPADLKKMAAAQKWQGPVVRDTKGEMTRALNAKVTTEVFVLDGARTLVYRGAVSDQYGLGYARNDARQHYLSDALDAVLTGTVPIIAATEAPGCALAVPTVKTASATPVTYYSRISRLMQTHCVECHHNGGTGPFPLDTLESVRSHAAAIQQAVERRAMPPWSAAPPPAGHDTLWVNDRSLPKQDKTDLLAWLGGNKPLGNVADAPVPRSFAAGWKIGKPDAQFQVPKPVAVKADGVMPYVNIDVPTNIAEDKWISGLEIQPTDRSVVHHVLVFAIPRDASGRAEHNEEEGLNGFLAGYVPGTSTFIYPEGFAKKLPANSILRFQIHYTPNGTATTDQTRLGLKFASKPPVHEIRVAGIANVLLNIPAGSVNHPEKGVIPVPVDAKILAFMPHMHVRAKSCRYDLVTPTGQRETLLNVPQYDFNWQHYYRYADPLNVSKGSSIEFTAWYDNSAANPANPDPNKNVRWGPQTTDEMLLGYVEYYVEGEGDMKIATSLLTSLGGIKGIEVLFKQLDKDGDGKLTRTEFPRKGLFDRLDIDHDGFVTMDEIRTLAAALGGGTTGKPAEKAPASAL